MRIECIVVGWIKAGPRTSCCVRGHLYARLNMYGLSFKI